MLPSAVAFVTMERHPHDAGSPLGGLAIAGIVLAVIGIAIAGRIIAHSFDRTRIATYAASQGWTLTGCQWKLFGPGWLGGNKTRVYAITYTDREGRTHTAFARTSVLSGVYLTEDRIVS
jgi:hypothetical protein